MKMLLDFEAYQTYSFGDSSPKKISAAHSFFMWQEKLGEIMKIIESTCAQFSNHEE
jgi:hypothetical protein